MKLSNDEIDKVFAGLKFPDEEQNKSLLFDRPEPDLLVVARKLCEVMHDNKLIKSKVNPDKLFIEGI